MQNLRNFIVILCKKEKKKPKIYNLQNPSHAAKMKRISGRQQEEWTPEHYL